jgi:hypothetical protein
MNFKSLGFSDFLEEDEIVESVFRHPFSRTFMKIMRNIIVFGALGWLIYFYLNNYHYDYSQTNRYGLFFLIPVFVGIIRIFKIFIDWYGNAILMTTESLVFAEFVHLFDRKITRIDYWDLDDVELEKKGVSDYIGNRGDLIFTKVSGGKDVYFKRINNPKKIIEKIRKHKSLMLDEKNFTEESALKDLLSKLVQTHVRKDGQPERKQVVEEDISEEVLEKENLAKKEEKYHFHNDLDNGSINIEIEKELDDEGGLEIEL